VALPKFLDLGRDRGLNLVLDQHLLGDFLSRGGADCRTDRTHQHDGVHPSAVQRPADPDPVRTRSHHRNRLAASAQRAIANGCADAQLLVMAVVTPEERPGAASVTAVPKTFAWGAGSVIAGYLLAISTFGWPLVIAGVVKGVYDILLLINFQKVRPPEEVGAAAG